jgi:hypothetical protein
MGNPTNGPRAISTEHNLYTIESSLTRSSASSSPTLVLVRRPYLISACMTDDLHSHFRVHPATNNNTPSGVRGSELILK